MLSVLNLDKVEFSGLGFSAAGHLSVWRHKPEIFLQRVTSHPSKKQNKKGFAAAGTQADKPLHTTIGWNGYKVVTVWINR